MLFARAALSIAPDRSPRAQPAPSRARGSLRATPPASTRAGFPRIVPRLQERCVSPTSATNSRHEHLHAAQFPITARVRRLGFRLLDATSGEPSGGAPLDGGPPASALLKPTIDAARTEVSTPPPLQAIAILVDPRSRDPSRCATRLRPCRPRVELPARPLTPYCRDRPVRARPCCRRPLSGGRQDDRACRGDHQEPHPPPPRSKVTTSTKPGRLPSTSALSSAVVRSGFHRILRGSKKLATLLFASSPT